MVLAHVVVGDRLIAEAAARMTDDQASIRIPARIVSDSQVVLDEAVPVGSLVRGPADVHLRLHTQQLAALQAAPSSGALSPRRTQR
jgi:hypothetical protein